MTRQAQEATRRMIARYELHTVTPVRLDPLDDLFSIRYADMVQYGALGAVLTPEHGWPVSPTNRARILLDYSLGDTDIRLATAHEIGHAMCRHHGNLSSLSLGLDDKHERQAWEVAALLLIPWQVVVEEREVNRIAAVCHVPEWLVEIWQSING